MSTATSLVSGAPKNTNKAIGLLFDPTLKIFSFASSDAFFGNVSVDADFIRVDVKTSAGKTKSDLHMHVFPKKDVLDRQRKPGGIPLDVALVMFDSTSAANFRRKMPDSFEYLTKNLDSLFLQGELACHRASRRQTQSGGKVLQVNFYKIPRRQGACR